MALTVFHSGYVAGAPTEFFSTVAVKDSIIIAVGSDAEALIPQADQLHDLRGGYLGPAFGDGHAHPLFAGLEDVGPQIRGCSSLDEILDSVEAWANKHPDAEWIIGASYDATFAKNGYFDARWLDAVVPDRPVMLKAWDYHTVWVNSKALEIAGITENTPEPELGAIIRRADGSPLGTLCEPGAIDLVAQHAPSYSLETHLDALERATASFAAAGVSWVQDAWVELSTVAAYIAAARAKVLSTRLNLAFRADPLHWQEQLAGFEFARNQVNEAQEELLTSNTIKFFLDGIIESHTAHLLDSYTDRENTYGAPNWSDAALREAAIAVDALGFQLHLHAIGDAAIRQGLDAIQAVQAANGPRDRRPVIAHLKNISAQDMPRFKSLGVIANFEPLWAQQGHEMLELCLPRLGEQRFAQQFPMADLAQAGVVVTFGSDWPVTHHHPLAGIGTAITREGNGSAKNGYPPLPGTLFNISQSLRSYSSQVAYQAFAEHERGVIETGKIADFVWLEKDPRSVRPHDVASIPVLGTWLNGNQTHGTA